MNRKMIILFLSIIIFLISSASLFTYYKVYDFHSIEEEFFTKTIKWEEYNANKPKNSIKLFNKNRNEYDEYHLDIINLNEVVSSSKDIIKEINKYSDTKLDKDDFPDLLEIDKDTKLKLKNVIVEPIYKNEKQWYEEIISQVITYDNLDSADLINIPKEIHENGYQWFVLTDSVKFDIQNGKFNCNASYSRIKRVEEVKSIIDKYLIKGVYSGKKIFNTGNVTLKYKIVNTSKIKEISPQFSYKLLAYLLIMFILVIPFYKIYKRLKVNHIK